jgi:hypothetical protein
MCGVIRNKEKFEDTQGVIRNKEKFEDTQGVIRNKEKFKLFFVSDYTLGSSNFSLFLITSWVSSNFS